MSLLLCRMPNGTVSRITTHTQDGDTLVPLTLTKRQHAIMHAATRIIVPDDNGNGRRSLTRK
jgi:hypothetical protein